MPARQVQAFDSDHGGYGDLSEDLIPVKIRDILRSFALPAKNSAYMNLLTPTIRLQRNSQASDSAIGRSKYCREP